MLIPITQRRHKPQNPQVGLLKKPCLTEKAQNPINTLQNLLRLGLQKRFFINATTCGWTDDGLWCRWFDRLWGPRLLYWHGVSWEHPLPHCARPHGDFTAQTAAQHRCVFLRPDEIPGRGWKCPELRYTQLLQSDVSLLHTYRYLEWRTLVVLIIYLFIQLCYIYIQKLKCFW